MPRKRIHKYYAPTKTVCLARREWLNPKGYVRQNSSPGGSVTTYLNAKKGDRWGTIELIIADCTRKIELDLSCDDPDGQKKTIRKLDKLIGIITELRDAVNTIKLERREEMG